MSLSTTTVVIQMRYVNHMFKIHSKLHLAIHALATGCTRCHRTMRPLEPLNDSPLVKADGPGYTEVSAGE